MGKVKELWCSEDAQKYEHIAEEAIEVAHAALKLARILRNENPTPVNFLDAFVNLDEEFADLILCTRAICLEPNEEIMQKKHERWLSRQVEREA